MVIGRCKLFVMRHVMIRERILVGITTMLLLTTNFRSPMTNASNLKLALAIQHGHLERVTGASLYLQGLIAYKQKQYREAIFFLRQVDIYNVNAGCLEVQAQDELGDWEEALTTVDLRFLDGCKPFSEILFSHLSSLSSDEQMQWQQRLYKEYPELLIAYAKSLFDKKDYAGAIPWAKSFPGYDESPLAQLIVGMSYFYLNRNIEAEITFQTAYQTLPPSHSTAYWYGVTLLKNGKPQAAIPLLEEAIRDIQSADSPSTEAWYLGALAKAYANVGKCAEARIALEQAFVLDHSQSNINRVDNLLNYISVKCSDK